jgi:hypothetical protein
MPPISVKQLPLFPNPPSIETITSLVTDLALKINGIWTVDLKQSDSIAEFIELMGAPWAISKLIKVSGEPTATRTFILTESGLSDTIESKGALGKRKDITNWEFKEFTRINPMGMPPSPSLLWIDDEKRLVMMAHNVTKLLRITTTLLPIMIDESSKIETLTAKMLITDVDGKEVLSLKRVMTRIRS